MEDIFVMCDLDSTNNSLPLPICICIYTLPAKLGLNEIFFCLD